MVEQEIIVKEDFQSGFWCEDYRYQATIGEYDLDCTVGHGKTSDEAIADLLEQIGG